MKKETKTIHFKRDMHVVAIQEKETKSNTFEKETYLHEITIRKRDKKVMHS